MTRIEQTDDGKWTAHIVTGNTYRNICGILTEGEARATPHIYLEPLTAREDSDAVQPVATPVTRSVEPPRGRAWMAVMTAVAAAP